MCVLRLSLDLAQLSERLGMPIAAVCRRKLDPAKIECALPTRCRTARVAHRPRESWPSTAFQQRAKRRDAARVDHVVRAERASPGLSNAETQMRELRRGMGIRRDGDFDVGRLQQIAEQLGRCAPPS